ncbi:MAG: HD domain-containing protein [Candidatus Hydrogenedentes bacterium]|nr:HD domain-containing protein [Candidatus Hydrogenedentota bacterium]
MPHPLTRATANPKSGRLDGPYDAMHRLVLTNKWVLVRTALQLAITLHNGQMRRSGEPYIHHPLRVALKLWAIGIREEYILAAALLHDVLEDCADKFDKKTTSQFCALDTRLQTIVQLLTKNQTANNGRYFERICINGEASLIKLADRADNLATMNGAFTQKRAQKYVEETRRYIMPLARKRLTESGDFSSAFEALHHEIQFLNRKAEKDFNPGNRNIRPTICNVPIKGKLVMAKSPWQNSGRALASRDHLI